MKIIITGRGIKITSSIKDKIYDMLQKHEKFLNNSLKIEVELKQIQTRQKALNNLTVEVTIYMPKVLIRVEETGNDFYKIVDIIDPILRRRLVMYNEYKKRWEGRESWKVAEIEELSQGGGNFSDERYAGSSFSNPLITRYKKFSQNSPMRVEEAIERMELLGHEAFLFKNIETNKYSMIYKKKDGTYGLVEPKD